MIGDDDKPLAMLALRVGGTLPRIWSKERFDERRVPDGLLGREDYDICR